MNMSGKVSFPRTLWTLLALLFTPVGFAQYYPDIKIPTTSVVSIYDGDSFRIDIPDYPKLIGQNVPVRVLGIDTPEMRGKCEAEKTLARKAKQKTVELLRSGKTVHLRKYFRILAEVYIDDVSLGEKLVDLGLARPYNGGMRESCCGE